MAAHGIKSASVVVVILGLSSTASTKAFAQYCAPRTGGYCINGPDPSNGHYYAKIEDHEGPGPADFGAQDWLYTTALDSGGPYVGNFTNHEMWYNVSGTNAYWVEVGVHDGLTGGGGYLPDEVFWADSRNGGGYWEHYYPNISWQLNVAYNVTVETAGWCAWAVWFGGIQLGVSTSNCPDNTGRILETGIETLQYGSYVAAAGHTGAWNMLGTTDTWVPWFSTCLYNNCPMDIEWIDGDTQSEEEVHGPF